MTEIGRIYNAVLGLIQWGFMVFMGQAKNIVL